MLNGMVHNGIIWQKYLLSTHSQDILNYLFYAKLPPKIWEQENDAGNALSQNVRAVEQRNTEKTHVMTPTE